MRPNILEGVVDDVLVVVWVWSPWPLLCLGRARRDMGRLGVVNRCSNLINPRRILLSTFIVESCSVLFPLILLVFLDSQSHCTSSYWPELASLNLKILSTIKTLQHFWISWLIVFVIVNSSIIHVNPSRLWNAWGWRLLRALFHNFKFIWLILDYFYFIINVVSFFRLFGTQGLRFEKKYLRL